VSHSLSAYGTTNTITSTNANNPTRGETSSRTILSVNGEKLTKKNKDGVIANQNQNQNQILSPISQYYYDGTTQPFFTPPISPIS
jgi:hypothetical protein